MAFKLTASERKHKDELLDELTTLKNAVDEAVTQFNNKLEDVREFVNSVRDRFQEEFDEKSETWQEGDKGSEAQNLISEYDNFEASEIEFECDVVETFENLPTEPQ